MAPASYTIIQRSLCFRNSTQMVSQFIVSKKVASWASVYTDALFRQTRPPARFAKPACWGHPQSPYDCQLRCQAERRFTPLVTITYNKKDRARQIRNPSISALPFSSLLLQFFPLLSGGFPFFLQVIAVELLHVLSGLQQLLHP